ncbi:hypothetical protein GI584_14310 [Gracilibacillus salitolerans]|uniref:Transglycosylase n=1 Tax=Gracilibacillus salitolerans TaxID=2663022 RepID=A0A5Q2TKI2_9BACI|nr:hypothetical protein [Gracilibacillus salitolerans]QGH35145.1 hypothetical protein GI584_14310 [Gracilibacillus salitolerans]
MIAQCTNCGMPTTIQFKDQDHPKGIKETYFKCQHCHKRFTCYVTNKAVRAKQKEIRRTRDQATRERLQLEVNQRMKELKADLE